MHWSKTNENQLLTSADAEAETKQRQPRRTGYSGTYSGEASLCPRRRRFCGSTTMIPGLGSSSSKPKPRDGRTGQTEKTQRTKEVNESGAKEKAQTKAPGSQMKQEANTHKETQTKSGSRKRSKQQEKVYKKQGRKFLPMVVLIGAT